jgi:hypothetical protein
MGRLLLWRHALLPLERRGSKRKELNSNKWKRKKTNQKYYKILQKTNLLQSNEI